MVSWAILSVDNVYILSDRHSYINQNMNVYVLRKKNVYIYVIRQHTHNIKKRLIVISIRISQWPTRRIGGTSYQLHQCWYQEHWSIVRFLVHKPSTVPKFTISRTISQLGLTINVCEWLFIVKNPMSRSFRICRTRTTSYLMAVVLPFKHFCYLKMDLNQEMFDKPGPDVLLLRSRIIMFYKIPYVFHC